MASFTVSIAFENCRSTFASAKELECGLVGTEFLSYASHLLDNQALLMFDERFIVPYGMDQRAKFTATFAERNSPAALRSCGTSCVGCLH